MCCPLQIREVPAFHLAKVFSEHHELFPVRASVFLGPVSHRKEVSFPKQAQPGWRG